MNRLTRFWQELTRRKVIKVAAIYAATSFVIKEVGDIILPRLGLPEWTVTFIIVLLIIGFPITLILSWIFDVTPEGIKKTESLEKAITSESHEDDEIAKSAVDLDNQIPFSYTGKRSLAAIMFTDLVGFTSMMAKDENKTLEVLEKIRSLLKPLIKEYNGKWQKELGDGSLSSFSSAVNAVQCAIDFQKAIGKEDFKIRIGIHVGEVTMTEDDIFGDGVNIAARIEPLGLPGGICITDRVFEDISNKPEIKTALLGVHELKNVDRPVTIHTLIGEGLPDPPRQGMKSRSDGFLKTLWRSRIPQLLFLYLLASFFIVQIVHWILDRYMLSPHWLNLSWILLLSLLPSVALMSYNHGNTGLDKLVRAEKIFIPVNLVFTAFILFLLFQGKDLGAITQEISVEDEEGNVIQRIIPKNEFIKNITIFDFENSSDDEHLNWLSNGISWLIKDDLNQDMFITSGYNSLFYDELTNAGIKEGDVIPFELKRDIAKRIHMDYFLSGNFKKDEAGYEINTKLFQTSNGVQIATHTLKGQNLFDLGDQMAVSIKEDLKLPDSHIKSVEDLPISSLLTEDINAYEYYARALAEMAYRNDWETGIYYLEKALQLDPEFIYAYHNLADFNFYSDKIDEAIICIDKVMDKIYMLPENFRFGAKYSYYQIHGDLDKQIKTQEMALSLYPNDMEAVYSLALDYLFIGENAKAEQVIKSALEFDDYQGNLFVTLAEALKAQEKEEEALIYYQLYAEKYPTHARSFQLLGDYYLEAGDLEEAKQQYEKSLVLSMNNSLSMTQLAEIEARQGNFDEAEKEYIKALNFARSSQDSIAVYEKLMPFYILRGQINQAIRVREENIYTAQNYYPPAYVTTLQVNSLHPYFLINRPDKVLDIIHQIENADNLSQNIGLPFAYFFYYRHQKNIPKAEAELNKIIEDSKLHQYFRIIIPYIEGDLLMLKEEYEQALEKYKIFKNDMPENRGIYIDMAECYMIMNRKNEAKTQLSEVLKMDPYHARTHLLMAKILLDQNKKKEAKEHLITANNVWENADEEYDRAQEAKMLLDEL